LNVMNVSIDDVVISRREVDVMREELEVALI
jgi:hypothetical protein